MIHKRTVYLVDDEERVRRSVGFMLRQAQYHVRTWESGTAFLKDIEPDALGCAVIDLRMPGLNGLDVQAELATRGVAVPVILLSGHGDVTVAVRAMKAGAIDFVEKPFARETLLAAVAQAFAMIEDVEGRKKLAWNAAIQVAALTSREREVLRGLMNGLSNKSIAAALGISPRTVEVHRAHLMAKLGAPSLSVALRIAFAADEVQGNGYDEMPS